MQLRPMKCNCGKKHVTLEEYKNLAPYEQGYIAYIQAYHPGSELKGNDENPYPKETGAHQQWKHGNVDAMMFVQDCDD